MRKLTTEEFIIKAKAVHGDRYDYGKSVYVGRKKKITITCNLHGDFLQTPNNHLYGYNCIMCGDESKSVNGRIKHDDFISRSILAHGNIYDYSKAKYSRMHDEVIIICREHGEFFQTPHKHISGHGCHECGGSRKKTLDEVIKKFTDAHGDRYDYSYVELISTTHRVKIRCNKHGFFYQSPVNHSAGNGCPSCADYGFSQSRDAFVYFLMSNDLRFMKIGITHDKKRRLSRLKSNTPFDFFVFNTIARIGSEAQVIEKYFHSSNSSAKLQGFDGCTEWVICTPELIEEVKGL